MQTTFLTIRQDGRRGQLNSVSEREVEHGGIRYTFSRDTSAWLSADRIRRPFEQRHNPTNKPSKVHCKKMAIGGRITHAISLCGGIFKYIQKRMSHLAGKLMPINSQPAIEMSLENESLKKEPHTPVKKSRMVIGIQTTTPTNMFKQMIFHFGDLFIAMD
jgi:hypothetical protein